MSMMSRMIQTVCFILFSSLALAVVDGHKYPFEDPEDITRFQLLSEELRCPKCQNQNLADSNAPVAADMRDKVYELMQDGKSDQEVVAYLVARYGDFVRYRPPVRSDTFFLWFGPLIVFLLGAVLLVFIRRSGSSKQITPLSDEEKQRLEQLKEGQSGSANNGERL